MLDISVVFEEQPARSIARYSSVLHKASMR